jgi:hypothetical protein
LFVYFAARWDEPHGDFICNYTLGEKTNIAAKLTNMCEDPQNSCNVVVLREGELRLPNSYMGKDYSEDHSKSRATGKYCRIQSSIAKFMELTEEAIEQRKVILIP